MTRCSLLNDAAFQEFSAEHINYFGPVSLKNVWQKHGFTTVGLRQTEIEQVPGLTVFEIKAMFSASDAASGLLSPDHETKEELKKYLIKSADKLKGVEGIIDDLVATRDEIVVWGVGTHTQSLLATTRLKQANIASFVDSNARYVGQRLLDIPILPVTALHDLDLPILVCSQQFQQEIVETIKIKMGLPNRVITLYAK